MKRILFTLSILVASTFAAQAQTNLDSLWGVWNDKTQADTTRLKAMQNIASYGYVLSQPDSAFYFAQMGYDLAEKSGLKKQMANALNVQGISFATRGDNPKALDYYQRSLKIHEEIGNKKGITWQLNNIGSIYFKQSDSPKALDYYLRSLKINEEIGDKNGIASSLINTAAIYWFQGDAPQALDYLHRGLKICEEIGHKQFQANALVNIGLIYSGQSNYPRALEYYQRGLKIKEEIGDKAGIGLSLNNIGDIYFYQSNYPKALEYFQSSLKIAEEIGDKAGIAGALVNIGDYYNAVSNYPKALEYCKKGYELALSIGVLGTQKAACSCLYDAYKDLGNSSKALEYYEQMIVIRDSTNNEENTKKLTQLEMQYEFDKKEALAQAEQEKKDALSAEELGKQKLVRNGFIGGFAVVLLFAGMFFAQKSRIGKEKERSEELLLNILPEETAKELKDKGHSDAQLIDHVSVLFTDFKGFTAMSEQVTPKDLVADLHACFSEFDHICEKFGIEKIKTIGDSYMAAGGLPTVNQTHATDVVKAALEMAAVVEKGKAEKIAQNLSYFEMRVGAHTGPVVAGIVGVKKFQYDIWGDTVNTASRMESSGEVGKVNISQFTYELIKNDSDFTFESRGKFEVKGKGEIEMYFVSKA